MSICKLLLLPGMLSSLSLRKSYSFNETQSVQMHLLSKLLVNSTNRTSLLRCTDCSSLCTSTVSFFFLSWSWLCMYLKSHLECKILKERCSLLFVVIVPQAVREYLPHKSFEEIKKRKSKLPKTLLFLETILL